MSLQEIDVLNHVPFDIARQGHLRTREIVVHYKLAEFRHAASAALDLMSSGRCASLYD